MADLVKRRKSRTNERTYALNEPKATPKIMHIPIKIKDHFFEAMIDTGSVENYLPDKILSKIKIEKKKLSSDREVEMTNGEIITVNQCTDHEIELQNDTNNKYKSKFFIIQNPHEHPILGMRFLIENDAIINLKEGIVIFDGTEYEITNKKQIQNIADREITAISKIYPVINAETRIKTLIQDAKFRNPPIGNIPFAEHTIELTSPFEKIEKEYNVPIELQDDVSRHLKDLIEKQVISEKDSDMISSAFIIKKNNGKLRLVVDYRYLNTITRKHIK